MGKPEPRDLIAQFVVGYADIGVFPLVDVLFVVNENINCGIRNAKRQGECYFFCDRLIRLANITSHPGQSQSNMRLFYWSLTFPHLCSGTFSRKIVSALLNALMHFIFANNDKVNTITVYPP